MEIKGTIIHALPEVSGTSKAGNPWKKKEYVLENTDGQFPRKVAFTCFGDNADKINLQVGQVVTIYFDIESREWQGRWFTDIRCWRADVETPGAAAPAAAPAATPGAVPPPPAMPAGGDDEFPF
ncbi:MAG: DUF3127 domain-containing protein [Muribaculaceae bacterium]|nr:DUF3127 domain-containing protein [Muribaculaceae bacterium]